MNTNVKYPIRSLIQSMSEKTIVESLKKDFVEYIKLCYMLYVIISQMEQGDIDISSVGNNISFLFKKLGSILLEKPFWPLKFLYKYARDLTKIFLLRSCWTIDLQVIGFFQTEFI